MKKVLAFLAALTLVVSVTACGDRIRQENQSQTSSDTSSDTSADQTGSGNPDNSGSENSEPEPEQPAYYRSDEEGFKELLDSFNLDDFKIMDGEVLKKAGADYLFGNGEGVYFVGYDHSYMRRVDPYFRTTFDESGMINWDTLETSGVPETEYHTDYKYFKVKAGDVLENGLTVKSAKTGFGNGPAGYLCEMDIELDGEITLEGILKCSPEDQYIIVKGELLFYPDCAKQNDILNPYMEVCAEPMLTADPASKFAMAYNGTELSLGMVDDAPSDVSEMFADDTYIKAKVTLSDIKYMYRPGGVRGFATVKSVEKLG